MVTCPPSELWHDIGRSWTLQLLDAINREPRGFNQIKEALGISSKVLAERLEQLEDHDLITRDYYGEGRERSEISLTQKGDDFFAVVRKFREFTNEYYPDLPCGKQACEKCAYLE